MYLLCWFLYIYFWWIGWIIGIERKLKNWRDRCDFRLYYKFVLNLVVNLFFCRCFFCILYCYSYLVVCEFYKWILYCRLWCLFFCEWNGNCSWLDECCFIYIYGWDYCVFWLWWFCLFYGVDGWICIFCFFFGVLF